MHREPQDIFDLIGRTEQIERTAHAMRAMAHPLRLKILCVLGENEMRVRDIVEAVGTSQSNVSQHLAILREKSVLSPRKIANHVYYSITDPRILELLATMREVLCGNSPKS
ncbi:MAG: metalloregulator ArsR/SmtB family transcription factor [Burkholderiales bacterium]